MADNETGLQGAVPFLRAPRIEESAVEQQRRAAAAVLRRCSLDAGLTASARAHGHHQIWTRDAMIALLGGSLAGDPVIDRSLRASVRSLAQRQSPAGAIPNYVDPASGKPNFRAYADGGLWWIIGSAIVEPDYATIRRVLRWYECQDVDASGLISIQEASDWEDLFCVRGKGLYVNCLYVVALCRASSIAERLDHPRHAARYRERATIVRDAVNRRLWYPGDGQMIRHIADSFSTANPNADSLGRRRWIPHKRLLTDASYYLPYVSFREVGEWFDTLGNLMAILSGVAEERQAESILDFIEEHDIGTVPAKSIYPPVQPGSPDWRDYYGTLNLPHQYHNGGIWPFIGGFYVAALVKTGRFAEAGAALESLAEWNRRGEFCEWLHGETMEPTGVREQAWSAGMYLYAAECVAAGTALYF